MTDSYGRTIDYLRISVTDRCNERCAYCMPADGVAPVSHGEILSFDEIVRIARCASELGVKHLRLTGGEPLVRRGIADLARDLCALPGIETVSLTTNGTLLAGMADDLISAGVRSFNVSLDTLDPALYARLTRCGKLEEALAGIRAVRGRAGVSVKLDTVILGVQEQAIADVMDFAKHDEIHVRYIEMMPIGCGKNWFDEGIRAAGLTPGGARNAEDVKRLLAERFGEPEETAGRGGISGVRGETADVRPGGISGVRGETADVRLGGISDNGTAVGHGPAVYVRYSGMRGMTGFITAMSHSFCGACNRVRLTSQGQLKTCLQYDDGADLRALLRGGASDEEVREAVAAAIARKPRQHQFAETAQSRMQNGENRPMNAIGG